MLFLSVCQFIEDWPKSVIYESRESTKHHVKVRRNFMLFHTRQLKVDKRLRHFMFKKIYSLMDLAMNCIASDLYSYHMLPLYYCISIDNNILVGKIHYYQFQQILYIIEKLDKQSS